MKSDWRIFLFRILLRPITYTLKDIIQSYNNTKRPSLNLFVKKIWKLETIFFHEKFSIRTFYQISFRCLLFIFLQQNFCEFQFTFYRFDFSHSLSALIFFYIHAKSNFVIKNQTFEQFRYLRLVIQYTKKCRDPRSRTNRSKDCPGTKKKWTNSDRVAFIGTES